MELTIVSSEELFDDVLETHGLKLDGHLLVTKESESPASRTYDAPSRHASSSGGTEEQSHIQKRPPDALVFALAWSHFLGEINPDFGKLAERHGISESEAYATSYQFCFVLTTISSQQHFQSILQRHGHRFAEGRLMPRYEPTE